ncbi:hypothetical protein TI04_13480 [Achromatium sp. WMS2]|nr:hypothetical protein TI04_13480 [Achromatium sp. WMS2]
MNNRSKIKPDTLTDDENNTALDQLLQKIRSSPERKPVRIFTIGYALNPKVQEEAAALEILKQIAAVTEGQFFEASPDTIRKVLEKIIEGA